MPTSSKQIRGTALLFRQGCVLLVRDKGKSSFSLPGGRRSGTEALLCTAVREIYEELRMRTRKAERLYHCDYESQHNQHKVTLIESDDDPVLNDGELAEFCWWNQQSNMPRYAHIDAILNRVKAKIQ